MVVYTNKFIKNWNVKRNYYGSTESLLQLRVLLLLLKWTTRQEYNYLKPKKMCIKCKAFNQMYT